MSKATYVLETLGINSLRLEAVVQLLIFAEARKSNHDRREGGKQAVVLFAVDGDISGKELVRERFRGLADSDVEFLPLPKPEMPILGFTEHQQVYAVFEALKESDGDEIHFPDFRGVGHYLTLAKRSGVHFCDTTLVAHIVGGTLFSLEAEETLVDSETTLMLDVFECGSTEYADVVFVHDRLAWAWYRRRLQSLPEQVFDVAWGQNAGQENLAAASERTAGDSAKPVTVVFFGPLGQEAGLRGFCDAITLFLRDAKFPIEVIFLGQPKQVGTVDAVSYIRIRTQNWKVPVTINRNVDLFEAFDLVARGDCIVFCDASRKEGLPARLMGDMGVPSVVVGEVEGALLSSIPKDVVAKMLQVMQSLRPREAKIDLPATWMAGRACDFSPVTVPPLSLSPKGPTVSVVVTHFSRPEKLRFALQSLKAQTYRNFEVIVVDDGSPDPAVVCELEALEQEIKPLGWKLVRQGNRYLGAARNHGARLAQGKYVLFMDDDNCARPTELETLVAAAERLQADVVTPFYDGFEVDEDVADDQPTIRFAPVGGDLAFAVFSPALGDANALYSLDLFRRIGGFTEEYGITHEDWELHIRADLAGARRATLPIPLFWYRVDPAGMYRNQLMQLHRNANLRRHIRPYLEALPHQQAKVLQIAQGLSVLKHRKLPLATSRPVVDQIRPDPTSLPFGRVAIIVRTKDRPVMLQRAIRDILAQTYKDWVMVVVNDGGDVGALELVLDQFAEELGDRIVTVNNPVSLGMQTASNVGIDACDSDFIIIHDDDDTWASEFLTRTVARMDADAWNPRVAGVVTWSQVIVEEILDGYDIVETDRFIFNDKLYNLSLVDLGIENRFPPISFLFRRSAFEEVGRFREEFGVLGDWDFHLRVLQRFDIQVIPEPLAGYHHRPDATAGAYGNSVHAQKDVHIAKRMELVNSFLRGGDDPSKSALGTILLQGQIYKNLENEQRQNLKTLQNHLWEMEQRLKHTVGEASPKRQFGWFGLSKWTTRLRRPDNLIENGDFRNWSGPGKLFGTKAISTGIVSPGLVLSFGGREATYTLERKTSDGNDGLKRGKPYLRIVNKGQPSPDRWLWLEFPIDDVEAIAGQAICVSGLARLQGVYEWISVGGRIDLPNRSRMTVPEQKVFLTEEFQPWHCKVQCPVLRSVDNAQSLARVFLKLHYAEPFIFELTDMQAEIGTRPTRFRYRSAKRRAVRDRRDEDGQPQTRTASTSR